MFTRRIFIKIAAALGALAAAPRAVAGVITGVIEIQGRVIALDLRRRNFLVEVGYGELFRVYPDGWRTRFFIQQGKGPLEPGEFLDLDEGLRVIVLGRRLRRPPHTAGRPQTTNISATRVTILQPAPYSG